MEKPDSYIRGDTEISQMVDMNTYSGGNVDKIVDDLADDD